MMPIRLAVSAKDRLSGLLGEEEDGRVLVLAPCHDIHTVGMRHPIDVAFVSKTGRVMAVERNVLPGRRHKSRDCAAVIERFSSAEEWFEVGDVVGVGKMPSAKR